MPLLWRLLPVAGGACQLQYRKLQIGGIAVPMWAIWTGGERLTLARFVQALRPLPRIAYDTCYEIGACILTCDGCWINCDPEIQRRRLAREAQATRNGEFPTAAVMDRRPSAGKSKAKVIV